MAYRFKRKDVSVQEGVRRIALEQIDKAIAEVDDGAIDTQETVHQVRKRCKKVRGLIRLVRPVFDAYRAENAAFRDAARPLSVVRDSEALLETYDVLLDAYADQIDRPAFAPIRRRLTLRQKQIAETHDLSAELADFRARMGQARDRVQKWKVDADGFEALSGGLAKTYGRARNAMRAAQADGTPEAFHQWRKRVKYHWYHARLLTPAWRQALTAHRDAADKLSDLLGDHHDLAVLRNAIAENPDEFGKPEGTEALLGLARARQAALEAEASDLGAKLLAEKKTALARRWDAYWTVWRRQEEFGPAACIG